MLMKRAGRSWLAGVGDAAAGVNAGACELREGAWWVLVGNTSGGCGSVLLLLL